MERYDGKTRKDDIKKSRPDRWTSDILAVKTDLTGTKLWDDLHTTSPVYGCILNTKEEDMAQAQKIIDALQAQVTPPVKTDE